MIGSCFAPPSRSGFRKLLQQQQAQPSDNNDSDNSSNDIDEDNVDQCDNFVHVADNFVHSSDIDEDNVSTSYWSELDSVDSDIGIDNYDSSQDNDQSDLEWPPTEEVLNVINQLPPTDAGRQAWEALIWHDCESTKADLDWYPWRNELCMLLFLCRYDPTYSISRNAIRCFIYILKTLQQNGHLRRDYWIPKYANTIEKWWKWLPKPPQRKNILYFMYTCIDSS